jgi:[histone H3]-lysine79 N-trimethyltransferase
LFVVLGNGTKSRRSRDLNKQHSGSTTESDDDFMGGSVATRKAWPEFVKEKSSQSEDELRLDKKKKLAKAKKAVAKKVPKGRIRKPKRPIKIDGLDLLHTRTLFSTSDQAIGMRLPPAQGCIDEHLAAYAGTMTHEELDMPSTSSETPYALKILLDVYKAQFMGFLDSMKSSAFKENLHRQIESKRDEYKRLMNRTGQLEKQIKVLVEDSVVLLKARMQELGISTTSQNDLLCKAKEIVGKHKELQIMANKIQHQVDTLEEENKKLTEKQSKELIDFELASKDSHDLVLKEIENTLIQRKNLRNKMLSLEAEVAMIEKANDDKKPSVADLQQPQQKSGIHIAGNIYKSSASASGPTKTSRKNREHRAKTHDWPEIPEIGKIEEKNPEILAQKILETGRQIEAGKLLSNTQTKQGKLENAGHQKKSSQISHQFNALPKGDPMSMAAPSIGLKAGKGGTASTNMNVHQGLPRAGGSKKASDSHKVVNFEDRLKSIITSALQGQDQQPPAPSQQSHTITSPQNLHQKQPQPLMIPTTSGSPKKTASVQMQYPGGNWNLAGHPHQQHPSAGQPQHLPTMATSQISPNKIQRQMVALPQMAPNLPPDQHASLQQHQESTYAQLKRNEHLPNFAKAMNIMHQNEANKLYQRPTQHQQIQMLQQQQQQNQYLQNQRERERENLILFQQRQIEEKREFKTPDNVRYERQDMGRSSVGSIESEYINSGGGSGSGNKSQMQRSSSSLSQPDYTQVSPAKLALRRHLSQEKLSQNPALGPQLMTKTIGDFISAEIEKTLEITPQSIINAVIQHNMPQSSNARMAEESVINFSINQEREIDDHHHPYATLKPSKSHQQQQQQQHYQQQQFHEHYVDQRQKNMLPASSKYAPSSSSTIRKSAISSPPIRHDEPIKFISGPKSPDRHHHRHIHHPKEQQESSSSSYKIDTKMFTSNIGSSYQAKEMKDVRGQEPLEGLAASLRQHVIASMKIKEENEGEPKYAYGNPPMSFPHIIKKESEFVEQF